MGRRKSDYGHLNHVVYEPHQTDMLEVGPGERGGLVSPADGGGGSGHLSDQGTGGTGTAAFILLKELSMVCSAVQTMHDTCKM